MNLIPGSSSGKNSFDELALDSRVPRSTDSLRAMRSLVWYDDENKIKTGDAKLGKVEWAASGYCEVVREVAWLLTPACKTRGRDYFKEEWGRQRDELPPKLSGVSQIKEELPRDSPSFRCYEDVQRSRWDVDDESRVLMVPDASQFHSSISTYSVQDLFYVCSSYEWVEPCFHWLQSSTFTTIFRIQYNSYRVRLVYALLCSE